MAPDEQPALTNSQVKKAGDHLRHRLRNVGDLRLVSADESSEWAWSIVERFVAAHYAPMVDLVQSASAISREFGVGDPVSRIKRSERIIEKIARGKSSLSSLQDIGGLRIVVPSLAYQYELAERLAELAYPLVRIDDYASAPGASPLVDDGDGAKGSGYRAVHLVHEVHGRKIETQFERRYNTHGQRLRSAQNRRRARRSSSGRDHSRSLTSFGCCRNRWPSRNSISLPIANSTSSWMSTWTSSWRTIEI